MVGTIGVQNHDGTSDDLLTAGLGKDGLVATATAPVPADPATPTAAELRRIAIFNNYRAIVDTNPAGRLWLAVRAERRCPGQRHGQPGQGARHGVTSPLPTMAPESQQNVTVQGRRSRPISILAQYVSNT